MASSRDDKRIVDGVRVYTASIIMLYSHKCPNRASGEIFDEGRVEESNVTNREHIEQKIRIKGAASLTTT